MPRRPLAAPDGRDFDHGAGRLRFSIFPGVLAHTRILVALAGLLGLATTALTFGL
jgi:hypothetical protein